MRIFLLGALCLLLAACGAPTIGDGAATPTAANDDQMIRDTLVSHLRAQGNADPLTIAILGQAGDFALAEATSAASADALPIQAILTRESGQWQILVAGELPPRAELIERGVPPELIP